MLLFRIISLLCLTLFYLILNYSRLLNDDSHLLQNAVINFANMIIGDIAIDISTIEREISYWTTFRFLTPNDGVRESFSLLMKHVSDLSKLATIQTYPRTFYDQVHHPKIIHVLKFFLLISFYA